jgi:hypothetical protein
VRYARHALGRAVAIGEEDAGSRTRLEVGEYRKRGGVEDLEDCGLSRVECVEKLGCHHPSRCFHMKSKALRREKNTAAARLEN